MFLHDHFFMIRDFSFARKDFLLSSQPYRLQEGRIVIVKRGKANYSFNLVEYEFEAGDVVVFMADTLVEKQGHSPDFEVDCISFDYKSPSLPSFGEGFISLRLNEVSHEVVNRHFELLWQMAHLEPFPDQNMKMLLNSLLYYIKNQPTHSTSLRPITHREETMKRFVTLVSQHAARERNIPFYASTVWSQLSKRYAKRHFPFIIGDHRRGGRSGIPVALAEAQILNGPEGIHNELHKIFPLTGRVNINLDAVILIDVAVMQCGNCRQALLWLLAGHLEHQRFTIMAHLRLGFVFRLRAWLCVKLVKSRWRDRLSKQHCRQ